MNNLLDVLVSYYYYDIKKGINHKITGYLLHQFDHIEAIEQKKLAAACQTTVGQLQKYANLLGYESFTELKKDLIFHKEVKNKQVRKRIENTNIDQIYEIYKTSFGGETCKPKEDLFQELEEVAQLIKDSRRIYIYGAVFPRALFLNTCIDFALKGKVIENYEDLSQEERSQITKEDLVIIISYTGAFIALKTKPFIEMSQLPCHKLVISQYTEFIDQNIQKEYLYLQLPYKKVDNHELNYILLTIVDLLKYVYYRI